MMRVDQAPMPKGFVDLVCRPGKQWLKDNPSATPVKSLWLEPVFSNGMDARHLLADSYHHVCSYSLFRVRESYDVDHYLPKGDSAYRNLAYCWYNYRLADSHLNVWKRKQKVPDPFTLPINACQLDFCDGVRIVVTKGTRNASVIDNAINNVMHLNEGSYIDNRRVAFSRYCASDPKLKIGIIPLAEDYPFVAYEMLRQGYLEEDDRQACIDVLCRIGFSWVKGVIAQ